jgi:glycosyltransferase involved in cell wall biosynthesis
MHILLITTYFKPDSGAAAVRLSRLAKLLARRGHKLTVLTSLPHYPHGQIAARYRQAWTVEEQRSDMRIIRSWLWATPSPRISHKLVSQLSFMLTTTLNGLTLPRPDVILIEAQPVFTSLAGLFLSRRLGAPYVLNVSDLWPDHLLSVGALTENHPVYRLARGLVDLTYRHAAAITAMSPLWAEKIGGYIGQSDQIQVLFNGVDLETFRPHLDAAAFSHKYGLNGCRTVSFIGTFATQYDFDTMLAVARRFKHRPDTQFVFIGQGSQNDILQRELAGGDVTNVRWLKWIDHAEMPEAWAASAVTFWALRPQDLYRGTIPAKLYEAMASGTPIVAATEDVAAHLITASGGGFAVPFGDVDGMTSTIQRLLDDDALRQQTSTAGRAYAEEHFDADRIASAYETVLQQALES